VTMTAPKPMSAKHRRIILAHVEKCIRLGRQWCDLALPVPSPAWDDVRAAEYDLKFAIEALARRREPKPPRVEKAKART
jgi:hypothetical protein